MTPAISRALAVTGFAFLAAYLCAADPRTATAACNDKCVNVQYGRYCSTGTVGEFYVEYGKVDCNMCSNSKNTNCTDGVNVPCALFGTGMNNKFRTAPKGTPVCPCGTGILRTDASAIQNPDQTWVPCRWSVCDGKPPS